MKREARVWFAFCAGFTLEAHAERAVVSMVAEVDAAEIGSGLLQVTSSSLQRAAWSQPITPEAVLDVLEALPNEFGQPPLSLGMVSSPMLAQQASPVEGIRQGYIRPILVHTSDNVAFSPSFMTQLLPAPPPVPSTAKEASKTENVSSQALPNLTVPYSHPSASDPNDPSARVLEAAVRVAAVARDAAVAAHAALDAQVAATMKADDVAALAEAASLTNTDPSKRLPEPVPRVIRVVEQVPDSIAVDDAFDGQIGAGISKASDVLTLPPLPDAVGRVISDSVRAQVGDVGDGIVGSASESAPPQAPPTSTSLKVPVVHPTPPFTTTAPTEPPSAPPTTAAPDRNLFASVYAGTAPVASAIVPSNVFSTDIAAAPHATVAANPSTTWLSRFAAALPPATAQNSPSVASAAAPLNVFASVAASPPAAADNLLPRFATALPPTASAAAPLTAAPLSQGSAQPLQTLPNGLPSILGALGRGQQSWLTALGVSHVIGISPKSRAKRFSSFLAAMGLYPADVSLQGVVEMPGTGLSSDQLLQVSRNLQKEGILPPENPGAAALVSLDSSSLQSLEELSRLSSHVAALRAFAAEAGPLEDLTLVIEPEGVAPPADARALAVLEKGLGEVVSALRISSTVSPHPMFVDLGGCCEQGGGASETRSAGGAGIACTRAYLLSRAAAGAVLHHALPLRPGQGSLGAAIVENALADASLVGLTASPRLFAPDRGNCAKEPMF